LQVPDPSKNRLAGRFFRFQSKRLRLQKYNLKTNTKSICNFEHTATIRIEKMPVLDIDKNHCFDNSEIDKSISESEKFFLSEGFNVETSIPKCLPVRKGVFFAGHGFTQDEQDPEILGSVLLKNSNYEFIPNEEHEDVLRELLDQDYVFVAEIYSAQKEKEAHVGVESIYLVEQKIARNAKGFGWN